MKALWSTAMYEFTDNVLRYLNREYIDIFSKLTRKSLAKMDEITMLREVTQTYSRLVEITKPLLLEVANWAYHNYSDRGSLPEMWLIALLERYSPVTKYVFTHEVDRKRSRLYEALIATGGNPAEIEAALRHWSKMIAEYAVEITDAATLEALKDIDVDLVEWFTAEDERVCPVCGKRHGKIYPIDDIPPKPHWGCRCYVLPLKT